MMNLKRGALSIISIILIVLIVTIIIFFIFKNLSNEEIDKESSKIILFWNDVEYELNKYIQREIRQGSYEEVAPYDLEYKYYEYDAYDYFFIRDSSDEFSAREACGILCEEENNMTRIETSYLNEDFIARNHIVLKRNNEEFVLGNDKSLIQCTCRDENSKREINN